MSATGCAVPRSSSGSGPREDLEPLTCFACKEVKTLNRCMTCTYCVLCSKECAMRYRQLHCGNASCVYHKVSRKYAPCIQDASGTLTELAEDKALSEHGSAPLAMMGHTDIVDNANLAVLNGIRFVTEVLHAHRNSAPMSDGTLAIATLASDEGGNGTSWTLGFLRSTWMPDPSPEVTTMQMSRRQHYEKHAAHMLAHASRLAVAQSCVSGRAPRPTFLGHSFLIAGVVRIADPASDGFRTVGYGLQVDIVTFEKTLNSNLQYLSCERTLADAPATSIKAALTVLKLTPSIHPSGMAIFGFPEGDKQFFPSKFTRDLPPLCSWDVVRRALHNTTRP